ncbi:hypothetical protein ACHQM5_023728 [Ranunculus cassubicifolius]
MRKKGIGGGCGVAVMEFRSRTDMVVGVRTRAQARTLAMATSTSSSPTRRVKRKVDESPELYVSASNSVQTRRRLVFTPETSRNSGQESSKCESNGSSELVNERSGVDLESEELSSTYLNCRKRDDTPSSSFRAESSDDKESTRLPSVSRSRSEPKMSPSEAEIEDFFSIAEKIEQRRFAEKYNYDIAKDVPLKGRYKWIPMTP